MVVTASFWFSETSHEAHRRPSKVKNVWRKQRRRAGKVVEFRMVNGSLEQATK